MSAADNPNDEKDQMILVLSRSTKIDQNYKSSFAGYFLAMPIAKFLDTKNDFLGLLRIPG